MKTPDKIYIQNHKSDAFTDWGAFYELEDGTVLDAEFHLKASKHKSIVANIEYLRKDALLEWATTNRDKLSVLSDNDAVHWGQRNAFQQMIDKLNQM